MAKYNSLGELFTAIANAIRSKTGGADPVVAEDFPTAIEGIEGDGALPAFTGANYLFYNGSRLQIMDQLLSAIDTSAETSFEYMFTSCSNLESIPSIDTSSGKNFSNMFWRCENLESIPNIDTSNGETFSYMFMYCRKLINVPSGVVVTDKATSVGGMFANCKALIEHPPMDTSNCSSTSQLFVDCSKLESITGLDLNKTNSLYQFIDGCVALKNLTLYNIRRSLQIGSGTTWGHLLTVDSLVHTIQELCTVTSTQTLTMGSANLEKIAGLYCKIIDDTVEKKTMELCENTDEGAMTLADYAAEKGWQIQ